MRSTSFLGAGRRLRAARPRRAGDARGRAAARPGARRARPGRRLRDAAAGLDQPAELLGALRLSRGRDRGRLRAGARAAVALARPHRRRVRHPVDAARHRRSAVEAISAARLPRGRRLRARRRVHRRGPASTDRRPSAAASTACPSGALAGYLLGALPAGAGEPTIDPIALATFAVLVAATVRDRLRTEAAVGADAGGAALAVLVIVHGPLDAHFIDLELPAGSAAGALPAPQLRRSPCISLSAPPARRCSAARRSRRRAARSAARADAVGERRRARADRRS